MTQKPKTTNRRKQKHLENKRKGQYQFVNSKIAFVSTIAFLLSAILNIIESWVQDSTSLSYIVVFIVAFLLFLISTNIFDGCKLFESEAMETVNAFITGSSVILYCVEIILNEDSERKINAIIITIIAGLILISAAYLFIRKMRKKKL